MAEVSLPYQHIACPAEVFLSQVIGGAGSIKGVRVERPSPNNVTIYHRYTPGWAVFFGFVGLLFFLLGALLWFIKRTDTASVIAVDAPGGCNVTISGQTNERVAYFLKDLVEGTAVKNYQDALSARGT